MNNSFLTTLDTIKVYFNKYVNDFELDNIKYENVISDISIINKITDTLVSLICEIGVDENLQPTVDGIILDGCLEALNNLRQSYYK